jgi:Kef-type K+ transport system membrane component KefB
MVVQIVLNLVVYLLFTGIGYLISKRIRQPKNSNQWILWILGVILAGGICVNGHAIQINDVLDLHVNDMLQALGIGVLIGFLIARTRQSKA